MNDENINKKSAFMYIDEEQLKSISGLLKKYSTELDIIKKHANDVWQKCSEALDENTLDNINSIKEINNKKYNKAMAELDNYANRIDTIANIWQETNIQIKNYSKNLETMFIDISKSIGIDKDNKSNS